MIKNIVNKAYNYSEEKHSGQFRKFSNLPYFSHPKYTARVVEQLTKNPEMVAAALLHDVIEDTDTTYMDLHKEFGPEVAGLVMELTSEKIAGSKARYLGFKMEAMTQWALTIKLADRFHNVLFLEEDDVPRKFIKRYWKQTYQILVYLVGNRDNLLEVHTALIERIFAILKFLELRYNFNREGL